MDSTPTDFYTCESDITSSSSSQFDSILSDSDSLSDFVINRQSLNNFDLMKKNDEKKRYYKNVQVTKNKECIYCSLIDSDHPISYVNEFITLNQAGKGHYSTVYVVESKLDHNLYAIKNCDTFPNYIIRNYLISEVETIEDIGPNQHIVTLYRAWEEEQNNLYLQFEYCSRGTLRDLINIMKPQNLIPERSIWIFLSHILHALRQVHQKGYVHRDIKPENIYIDEQGNYKLGDYGLCTKVNIPREEGDRRYMPWESLNENAQYYHDIYSLGVILYELMSYANIYGEGEQWTLLRQGYLIDLPSIYSKTLVNLMKKMIATDPKQRPSVESIYSYYKRIKKYQKMKDTFVISILPIKTFNNRKADDPDPLYTPRSTCVTPVYRSKRREF
ncbi:hypothetical protein WA158_000004 [Blastocystis sp. Blastoise]